MNQPYPDIYRYIVTELAPTAHKPDETPLSIVCEPTHAADAANNHGTVTLHLEPGTTPAQAQAIADTLQANVKSLVHVQAPAGGAVAATSPALGKRTL